MRNVSDKITKLEKKVAYLVEYMDLLLTNKNNDFYHSHVAEFRHKLSEIDTLVQSTIKLRNCPDCKHWWFDRRQDCGCNKFPGRYTYPTQKQHEVNEQRIPCEGFSHATKRLLRPV